jgi:uncharacterized protein (DUF433 family)
LTLARARHVFGAEGDSEAGRALLGLFAKLSAAVEQGTVISFLPGDDARAVDAFPELTRALRPENRYTWLVSVPHPWRKQLTIKGRRLTAGQLVDAMEANDLDIEIAAEEFDLPPEAVVEAVDYVARNRELVVAEAAEERLRTEPFLWHRGTAPQSTSADDVPPDRRPLPGGMGKFDSGRGDLSQSVRELYREGMKHKLSRDSKNADR